MRGQQGEGSEVVGVRPGDKRARDTQRVKESRSDLYLAAVAEIPAEESSRGSWR